MNQSSKPELTWSTHMRPNEAAEYLNISTSTLGKLRMRGASGCGPRFVKLGGVVLYRRIDLDDWLEQNLEGAP